MGLIEVMVAAAILGGLVMAFMRITDQIMKAESRMFALMEVQDLTQRLRYSMSNPMACTNTFSEHFPDHMMPLSGELSFLKDKNSESIAQVGEDYGPVQIENMRFQAEQSDVDGLGSMPGVVEVRVHMTFKGSRSYEFRKIQSFTAPVLGEYIEDEKKIKFDYCDSLTSPFAAQLVELTMKRMCEGFQVEYDRSTGSCDMGAAMTEMMNNQGGAEGFLKLLEQAFPKK